MTELNSDNANELATQTAIKPPLLPNVADNGRGFSHAMRVAELRQQLQSEETRLAEEQALKTQRDHAHKRMTATQLNDESNSRAERQANNVYHKEFYFSFASREAIGAIKDTPELVNFSDTGPSALRNKFEEAFAALGAADGQTVPNTKNLGDAVALVLGKGLSDEIAKRWVAKQPNAEKQR